MGCIHDHRSHHVTVSNFTHQFKPTTVLDDEDFLGWIDQPIDRILIRSVQFNILYDEEIDRQGSVSECEDEARERVGFAVGAVALPEALGGGEAGDGEVGVEVLAELGDHPIGAHRPGVHPVRTTCCWCWRPLGDDGGAEGVDGARGEDELAAAMVVGVGTSRARGEQAHHVLVLGRAMEPPLQVRRQERLHAAVVPGVQRLVQTEHQELVALLLGLSSAGGVADHLLFLQLRRRQLLALPLLGFA
ncbi:unnamed protein product [Urochloa humidicola]